MDAVVDIGARIAQLRGRSPRHVFAAQLGVHPNTLQRWENGERVPDALQLLKIAEATGCSVEWLLTGTGTPTALAEAHTAYRRALSLEEFVLVPRYEVEVEAGAGRAPAFEHERDHFAYRRDWIKQRGLSSKLAVVSAVGDSMEPLIRSGDALLVDLGAAAQRRDGIYLLRVGDALLVKRLQHLPGGLVRALSENAAYEPFEFRPGGSDSEPEIVGRVVQIAKNV